MSVQFKKLMNAVSNGDGQDCMNLIEYAWNSSNDVAEIHEIAVRAWTDTAARNGHGHPLTAFYAARLFGRSGRIDVERRCLRALADCGIAPAMHLEAAYNYQDKRYERAAEFSRRSGNENYLPGESLYWLVRSKMATGGKKAAFWLYSRYLFKRGEFVRVRGKYSDFNKMWVAKEFSYSDWQRDEYYEILRNVTLLEPVAGPSIKKSNKCERYLNRDSYCFRG